MACTRMQATARSASSNCMVPRELQPAPSAVHALPLLNCRNASMQVRLIHFALPVAAFSKQQQSCSVSACQRQNSLVPKNWPRHVTCFYSSPPLPQSCIPLHLLPFSFTLHPPLTSHPQHSHSHHTTHTR